MNIKSVDHFNNNCTSLDIRYVTCLQMKGYSGNLYLVINTATGRRTKIRWECMVGWPEEHSVIGAPAHHQPCRADSLTVVWRYDGPTEFVWMRPIAFMNGKWPLKYFVQYFVCNFAMFQLARRRWECSCVRGCRPLPRPPARHGESGQPRQPRQHGHLCEGPASTPLHLPRASQVHRRNKGE